jgi:hypothetical protein
VRYALTPEGELKTLDYQPAPGRLRSRRLWFGVAIIGAVVASVLQWAGAAKPKPTGVYIAGAMPARPVMGTPPPPAPTASSASSQAPAQGQNCGR